MMTGGHCPLHTACTLHAHSGGTGCPHEWGWQQRNTSRCAHVCLTCAGISGSSLRQCALGMVLVVGCHSPCHLLRCTRRALEDFKSMDPPPGESPLFWMDWWLRCIPLPGEAQVNAAARGWRSGCQHAAAAGPSNTIRIVAGCNAKQLRADGLLLVPEHARRFACGSGGALCSPCAGRQPARVYRQLEGGSHQVVIQCVGIGRPRT
jgi:hypothetical protein